MKNMIEKPDLLQYEDDEDIVVARPKSWEVVIFEKDSGNSYVKGSYSCKEEAAIAVKEEMNESNTEIEFDFSDEEDKDLNSGETLKDLKKYFSDSEINIDINGWELKVVHPGLFIWSSDNFEDIIYANPFNDSIVFRVYDNDEDEIEDLAEDIPFDYNKDTDIKENANKYLTVISEKLKGLEDKLDSEE